MRYEERKRAAALKLSLLSEGISFSDSFIEYFGQDTFFMEKRKVYNNSDEEYDHAVTRAPQELLMGDVISAVNFKRFSPWVLDYSEDQGCFIQNNGIKVTGVTFPKRPCFLNRRLSGGVNCGYLANLYGGMYLAFFTPACCHYGAIGMGCQYCSLKSNRHPGDSYAMWIDQELLREATRIALQEDTDQITGIMLVGGNLPDEDENFKTLMTLAAALEEEERICLGASTLELHIAVMPPRDFTLLKAAAQYNIRLSMNLEVFDDHLFRKYCPGKDRVYGRDQLKKAVARAAEILPYGKAHSILIAGLEPVESTIKGIYFLAENGVAPIINVFHNDFGTELQRHKRPSANELFVIGNELGKVYKKYGFTPYWNGCGRNSLDYEAKEGLFEGQMVSIID